MTFDPFSHGTILVTAPVLIVPASVFPFLLISQCHGLESYVWWVCYVCVCVSFEHNLSNGLVHCVLMVFPCIQVLPDEWPDVIFSSSCEVTGHY